MLTARIHPRIRPVIRLRCDEMIYDFFRSAIIYALFFFLSCRVQLHFLGVCLRVYSTYTLPLRFVLCESLIFIYPFPVSVSADCCKVVRHVLLVVHEGRVRIYFFLFFLQFLCCRFFLDYMFFLLWHSIYRQ